MATRMLSSLSSLAQTLAYGLMLLMTALPSIAGEATVVTWNQPTDITYGTPISVPAAATRRGVPVPGTFTYDPPLGTVLPQSNGNQRIWANFIPASGGKTERLAKNMRVSAAPLTVTSTATKVFGAAIPTLTPIYSGFVNGDTAATVLSGSPTLSTTATANSVVGSYPIAVSKGTLSANKNYSLQYVTGSLTVTRASASVTLSNLAHTYDGLGHGANVTTVPAGLSTSLTYNGGVTLPLNAGTYAVAATINNPNYIGSANANLAITRAMATVTLGGLAHTYDGNGHAATATTTPAGLATTVSYNGSVVLPLNAGSYTVMASVSDPNYVSFASGTLTIAQATQTISLIPLSDMMLGDVDQPLVASAMSGLPVAFAIDGPAEVLAGTLHATSAGTVIVTATQAGDGNWAAAVPVAQTITIAPSNRGLRASYFANRSMSGTPVLRRNDAQVDFDWASGSPAAGVVPADGFSVRWEGQIIPRHDERYTLTFRTDDGVRVWLDGVLVIDHWWLRSVGDSTWSFDAEAGRSYPIRVEYYENHGLAVAKVLWSSASESFAPIPSSQLRSKVIPPSPPLIGNGTGLTASYFANQLLAGLPAITRQDAAIDFDWRAAGADIGLPTDFFSARWSGFIQPRYSESYTLALRSDDGVRLWLDGELVIDDWFARSASNSYHTFVAEAGRSYAIRIEYFEIHGDASVQLSWFSASEYLQVVPAEQLYPAPVPTLAIANHFQPAAQREMIVLAGIIGGTVMTDQVVGWSQVSGPATILFGSLDQLSTTARFPETGTYTVQVQIFDGHHVIAATTSIDVVPSDVSNGLIAHYMFDEADGQTAFDSSGRQHHATITGATRTSGKSGGALHFDGDAIATAFPNEDLDPSGNVLTLAVWLKPDTTLQQMGHPWPMPIYRAQYETSTGYALMTTVADTDVFGLRMHHQAGFAQRVEVDTGTPLTPGNWIHAAGVFDGTTATLYLNGVAVRSITPGPITMRSAADVPLMLGMGFVGAMDDVRIYHRSLSRTDIHGLAQGGTPRRTPTVDAGDDVLLTLVSPTTVFAGSASDEGGSGMPLQANWRQIAGPTVAVFSDIRSFTPAVSFPLSGSYHFLLEVTDGVATGYDNVRVEVTDGSVDLLTGLILHHRCDEGSADLVSDASGAGHHGTWAGGALWSNEGQTMGAIRFDGLNGVITQSSPLIDSLSAMTLSVWMNLDRPLLEMAHPWPMAMYHADYASNRGFALMTTVADSGQFGLRLHTGTGRREVTTQTMPSGRWVHVTATYDGQAMRLYVDGTQVGLNITGALALPAFESPLYIGNGFESLFDEIRIYNRALSPTEVRALHTLLPLGGNG